MSSMIAMSSLRHTSGPKTTELPPFAPQLPKPVVVRIHRDFRGNVEGEGGLIIQDNAHIIAGLGNVDHRAVA